MDWLQLQLVVPSQQAEAIEDALLALGAVSVTLGERGEQPVLEPGVGEMPLWAEVALSALFDPATDRDAVLDALRPEATTSILDTATWEYLEDRAWEREWLRYFAPIRFGNRLWVCPHEAELAVDDAAVVLRLDPGLAFGTGTHPTTALCLEWLDAKPPQAQAVIDFGCGSGILGIAALLLGASHVHAVDIDPQALLATRENAGRNHIATYRLTVSDPAELPDTDGAELLLANILAGPLCELAPRFARLVRPGGTAVLSGVLGREQADAVCAAALPWFRLTALDARDDWWRIVLQREAVT